MKELEKIVKEILENYESCRSDDFLLVLEVYKRKYNFEVMVNSFEEIMKKHKEIGLPSFESITRARRKVFEKYPQLNPKKIQEVRNEQENKILKYVMED